MHDIGSANMDELIIWGTGDWGAQAYFYYKDSYNVLFFVDSDSRKWGITNEFMGGLKVYSPDEIRKFPKAKIAVAVKNSGEIEKQLEGYENSYILHVDHIQKVQKNDLKSLYENKAIDLRDLLYKVGRLSITQSFVWGSSGTMDYLLLCAIAKKFSCKKYFEIGTFIGDSIKSISKICEECHSLTAYPGSEYSMAEFCRENDIPDYSERLAYGDNIIHHYGDSKLFDFSEVAGDIDLFFIDGDHKCVGVYTDTKNIFKYKKKDAFVVWHDFKSEDCANGGTIYSAIKMAIGEEEFENVFAVNGNICGVYIPRKYQGEFSLNRLKWSKEKQDMYYYDIDVVMRIDKA